MERLQCIYIVTEKIFFIGVKEKLAESEKTIKMFLLLEFNVTKVDEFSDADIFIFHEEKYSTELLSLLITRRLQDRLFSLKPKENR